MDSGKVQLAVLSVLIGLTGTAKGLQNFNALIYTPQDLTFFSYEPNTLLEIADAQGAPITGFCFPPPWTPTTGVVSCF